MSNRHNHRQWSFRVIDGEFVCDSARDGAVKHQTAHYVVIKTEGWSSYVMGGHQYTCGSVEVREAHHDMCGNAFHRVDADRKWRSRLKEAIAKADEMEADWERMNAERTAEREAEEQIERAKQKAAEIAERMAASLALSSEVGQLLASVPAGFDPYPIVHRAVELHRQKKEAAS